MASRILQYTVALSCILLGLYTQLSSARHIPFHFGGEDSSNSPTQPSATTENTLTKFIDTHGDDITGNTAPVDGFHLKLEGDVSVGAETAANLERFALSQGDDGELFVGKESGFDNINGIFRPSNGLYLLSCLVHVAVKPQQEGDSQVQPTATTGELGNTPRVTVTICIDGNCGSSAILKSSSVLPSSGDLQTISLSGVLALKRGQEVTVQLNNHSKNRQVDVSALSTLSAHLLKIRD